MNAIDLSTYTNHAAERISLKKEMLTAWTEPRAAIPSMAPAGQAIEVIYQSPPCAPYALPLRRTTTLAGAK